MKRILLISYYFPPCGGAAVQRWLRLIPHLLDSGIGITVICPQSADYPYLDQSLLETLPRELRVIRCGKVGVSKTWSRLFPARKALPYGNLSSEPGDSLLRRILIWIRLNLVIPDMRIIWLPSALAAARQELAGHSYSSLITTGPPHSTHLAGLLLKRHYKLKWITDFRDPWLDIHYLKLNPPGVFSRRLNAYLERKVLALADLNLVVSKYIADQLPKGTKQVLYNGFDAAQFADIHYQPASVFRMKYIGQITAGQKLDVLAEILRELKPEQKIELSFVGTKLDQQQIAKLRLNPSVNLVIKGFVSHQEALGEMVQTELLVLLINAYEGSEGMLTTKLFEYLGSRSPILLLGNKLGEAAQLIRRYEAGACFDYHETRLAAAFITEIYRKAQTGDHPRFHADLSEIEASAQAQALIGLL